MSRLEAELTNLTNRDVYVNRTIVAPIFNSDTTAFATVKCQQEDMATGGGFIIYSDSEGNKGKIVGSEPVHITSEGGKISQLFPNSSFHPNAWAVKMEEGNSEMQLQVFVTCIDMDGGSSVLPISANHTVSIPDGTSTPGCEETDHCFFPYIILINAGDTVIWSNNDSTAHTVTSGSPETGSDGNWDSSLILSGSSFEHTFNDSGTFPYYCQLHPWQRGQILVN